MDWVTNHFGLILYALSLIGSAAADHTWVYKLSRFVLSGRGLTPTEPVVVPTDKVE